MFLIRINTQIYKISRVDITEQSPVILSLCTGSRGLERGVEAVIGKLTVAAYVEIEAFVILNLVKQMEQGVVDAAPVWSNLKTFPAEQFYGKIHGIIGGYPCQPFSVAGLRGGSDDPRHLWPFIKEQIRIIRPEWCFFENVANHLNIGYYFVRRELQELGYTVKEGIYSAEEVGATHQRKRLFILAVDNSCRNRLKQKYEVSARRNSAELTGKDVDDSGHEYLEKSCRTASGFGKQTGEELGHSTSSNQQRDCEQKQSGRFETGRSGEDMANSESFRNVSGRREYGSDEEGKQQLEGTEQSNIINSCESLADTDSEQRQLQVEREFTAEQFFGWPAPQGSYQHEWEEPRTVKPGLGCTIDGYNFRTDLLRMFGNGVVPQVSALAFSDLLNKHFESL